MIISIVNLELFLELKKRGLVDNNMIYYINGKPTYKIVVVGD